MASSPVPFPPLRPGVVPGPPQPAASAPLPGGLPPGAPPMAPPLPPSAQFLPPAPPATDPTLLREMLLHQLSQGQPPPGVPPTLPTLMTEPRAYAPPSGELSGRRGGGA